ncbi:MAG: hypothetical protein WD431_12795 [Cyclobacteriaceae bacterium]
MQLTIILIFISLFQIKANSFSPTEKTPKVKSSINDRTSWLAVDGKIIQFRVNGTVVDSEGMPLAGANVQEKGTSNGTQNEGY